MIPPIRQQGKPLRLVLRGYAHDGMRPAPIIRNRSNAKVQVTKSTLDALAAAASIS
jgi:hypothetical protein